MKRGMVFALATAALATIAAAQQPAPAPAPAPVAPGSKPGQYAGVASCVSSGCHGSTHPLKESRILQNEYYTWLNRDRHPKSYNVLFNERSARIVRNMRLKKKAYEETMCLDCHSMNVAKGMVSGRVEIEDGVQCEACHGPASGWRAEHTEAGWTHEKSVARGMTDLRDIPTRATTCLACHLGNKDKGVDHELIASGHPMLAFELDNYTETMPSHWTSRKETHGVSAWAGGQAVALRDSLANLARHARGEKWPEYSDLSCYNCHHALESGTWRQERGWPGRAGLPAWSQQHWVVLRQIIERAAPSSSAALDDAIQQIARASRMTDPIGVATAADGARRAIDALVPKIAAMTWRDDEVRAMMRTICGDDAVSGYDVHSAEQIALALQTLAAAVTRNNPALLKSPMTEAVDALFAEVQNRDRFDPNRFGQKLQALRGTI
ncbi:MAG: multiheme c-type cytochrome [Thermoanaerobaculia bacterium]